MSMSFIRIGTAIVIALAVMGEPFAPAQAQSQEDRMRLLEKTVEELLRRDEEKERKIKELEQQLQAARKGQIKSGETAASGRKRADDGDVWSTEVGDATLRFKRLGVDTALAAGYSSEKSEVIQQLQGGDHDPRQNGFTLQTLDLSFAGALDPYFDAQANLAFFIDPEGETVLEFEEAFMETRPLFGLRFKGGQFFTEFGRHNPTHLHAWEWLDQPVIATRLLGPDGIRNPGARLKWQAPTPWYASFLIGVQNATGETMASFRANDEFFEERPIGGRALNEDDVDDFDELTWHARLATAFDLGDKTHADLAVSGLIGPNATGSRARTLIGGVDAVLQRDLGEGRYIRWTTEAMYRSYQAQADVNNGLLPDTLKDYGLYTQVLWGFYPELAAGVRYEYATGEGESVGIFEDRNADPFRSDRHRVSPLFVWQFAPTAKFRLQYNYDNAQFLPNNTAHSVWAGLLWSFGLGTERHHDGHDHGHTH
ncbi:MAG: hypothetical protein QNJ94_01585 [Alphaproteobacteria bacterium]|nr:hypothetical protein [Alphaproteobacteria bacterium]